MPSVCTCFGAGKVFVEVQEARAGDVRLRVGEAAGFVAGEIVATVANDPVGIVEMRRELVSAYERAEQR
jgi:hypothetical protein